MNPVRETKFDTICNKYPTHRDEYVKGCWKWLKGRRADDNAEGLWRVWDKLYDLSEYIEKHPGGREWLILAKVKFNLIFNFESKIFNFESEILNFES